MTLLSILLSEPVLLGFTAVGGVLTGAFSHRWLSKLEVEAATAFDAKVQASLGRIGRMGTSSTSTKTPNPTVAS